MPQLTLKLSQNIAVDQLNFVEVFQAIHDEMSHVPNLDIKSLHSGVLQEVYSYIGTGDDAYTKAYLEVLWLENPERALMKSQLVKRLMHVLEEKLVPQINRQGLICLPRVRVGNLGVLGEDYLISGR